MGFELTIDSDECTAPSCTQILGMAIGTHISNVLKTYLKVSRFIQRFKSLFSKVKSVFRTTQIILFFDVWSY